MLLVSLLLAMQVAGAQPPLSDREWLDAVLRAEREQAVRPPRDELRPFRQQEHPEPVFLPFMPLPADWRLLESRREGREETWVWRQEWGRGHRRLSLTRAPVVAEKPLAVRHSLHHNSTVLRCLEPTETPLRKTSSRWQWEAACAKEHGGSLRQLFLLLRGTDHRYDLVLEWHDKTPGEAELSRWRQQFEAVRFCPEDRPCGSSRGQE